MSELTTRKDALDYHTAGRPGKIQVVPTKPCLSQIDLSLAYTPGVAVPCLEIEKDPDKVFDYTARGNLVAVVTDGSAVLGLGNIGPLAGKPVMEGKGVLFKRFADIDVFDIELSTQDEDEIVAAVKAIAPTVAGINLEDIAAPRCFDIERRLRAELDIPVFHDDQHGTALIMGAALLNALELAGKEIGEVKVVVNGAGAAAVACTNYAISLGVDPEKVLMCDSAGVIWKGRKERMNRFKEPFARETDARTLADAMNGADVFLGMSVGNVVSPDMLRSMNDNPIVLAMANPDPEIPYPDAVAARSDVIMATGRSDYPNQVNNVLGFPFIFRGAIDVRARTINTEMLHAGTRALAELAKEPVPDAVAAAYGGKDFSFGREYIIPKPLDHRVIRRMAPAIARAAMETGVARKHIDLDAYERELGELMGFERDLMRQMVATARREPKRIVYPEGTADRIVIAAEAVVREGIAHPVLLGNEEEIRAKFEQLGFTGEGIEILDPERSPRLEAYAQELYEVRRHRHRTLHEAQERLFDPLWYGPMMLRMGDADGLVCGVTRRVRKTMPPLLKVVPMKPGVRRACGMTIVFTEQGALFLADTSVNIVPSDEDLAEIAILAAESVKGFGIDPVVAMLSFSSFGGTPHKRSDKMRRAVQIVRDEAPELLVDGEMRVDAALDPTVQKNYADCRLGGKRANVLVFPDLQSANIAVNLLKQVAKTPLVGPVMLGFAKPAHMLQPHSVGVKDVVHLTAIACVEAQQAAEAALI